MEEVSKRRTGFSYIRENRTCYSYGVFISFLLIFYKHAIPTGLSRSHALRLCEKEIECHPEDTSINSVRSGMFVATTKTEKLNSVGVTWKRSRKGGLDFHIDGKTVHVTPTEFLFLSF